MENLKGDYPVSISLSLLKNIDIDINMVILENICKAILKNIDIDKAVLKIIDINIGKAILKNMSIYRVLFFTGTPLKS